MTYEERIKSHSIVISMLKHRSLSDLMKSYAFAANLVRSGNINNVRTRNDATPLMLAANNSDFYLVKEFVRAKADINSVDASGNTAFYYALKRNNYKICRLLAEHGANVNGMLNMAIYFKSSDEIVKLLISLTNINEINSVGNTSLFLAYNIKNFSAFELLIKAGANLNIKNRNGINIMEQLSIDKDFKTIKMIIDNSLQH